jgi:uncharacterized protein YjbI with pentapeptide repeats
MRSSKQEFPLARSRLLFSAVLACVLASTSCGGDDSPASEPDRNASTSTSQATRRKPVASQGCLFQAGVVCRDTSFSRLDLSGLDLSNADFSGSEFQRVKFDRTDLSHAVLDDVRVVDSSFTNANLVGASVSDAVFECGNTQVEPSTGCVDMERANLSRIAGTEADFDGTRLMGARMQGADLPTVSMNHADLTSASLRGSRFTDGSFACAILKNVDATGADFGLADSGGSPNCRPADNAVLTGSDFTGAVFRSVDAGTGEYSFFVNAVTCKTTLPDGSAANNDC